MTQDFICIISFLSRPDEQQLQAAGLKNDDGINYVPKCHVNTFEEDPTIEKIKKKPTKKKAAAAAAAEKM